MDQFLDPETDKNYQFLNKNLLDQETDIKCQFLADHPETDIMGERTYIGLTCGVWEKECHGSNVSQGYQHA